MSVLAGHQHPGDPVAAAPAGPVGPEPDRDAAEDAVRTIGLNRLITQVEGLGRLLHTLSGRLPVDRLSTTQAVVDRAGDRIRLSRDHTVVAIAGATGSGKSSLFNSLCDLEISRVSFRRPTTNAAHACVWNPDGATELLDWLGIPKRHQIARETVLDGESQSALRGLVLLDLPDFDSVEVTHQLEVDRLSGLADLLIWVLDPQKYADAVVHQRYLRGLPEYRAVTVVVLNQIDRLAPEDAQRCLADVRRLLDEDGLQGVRLIAASAVTGDGVAELRQLLVDTVAARQAALRRLAGDVATAVTSVAHVVGPELAEDAVDRGMVHALAARLGDSAGAAAVAEGAAAAYRSRGEQATTWPIAQWLRGLRPDPTRKLAGSVNASRPMAGDFPMHRHAAPEPSAAQRSQADLAVRGLADQVSRGLPEPWPEAITAVARAQADQLPEELERVIRETDLGTEHTPLWWRVVRVLQRLFLVTALTGAVWLIGSVALRSLTTSEPKIPALGYLPVPAILLVGGLVAGVTLAIMSRLLVGYSARRFGVRADLMLRNAIAHVARERVVSPIRGELHAYAETRDALAAARGDREV